VTGALPSEEREARVEALGEHEKRVLVATDCLSEGINLQAYFDAVVHYDLSWNPTRHQQREGRVDRFGQKAETVRAIMIYGENNPVDGAVLQVILRKAKEIEKQTGVQVPLPDEGGSLTKALMTAVILRARERRQGAFDFNFPEMKEVKNIDVEWINASEREKKARTIFAQNSLKPEEVAAEWDATFSALGSFRDVERFVSRAMTRLGATLVTKPGGYSAPLHLVPQVLKERFQAEGLLESMTKEERVRISFDARPPAGYTSIHRAHALPVVLAEMFLENALDSLPRADDPATLPRCGVWECPDVKTVQTVLLLRIRHRIDSRGRLGPKFAMAEEGAAITFDIDGDKRRLDGLEAFALLEASSGNVAERTRETQLKRAREQLDRLKPAINEYAAERAAVLAQDHSRVRQALGSRASVKVEAVVPPDIIGLYVLMPKL
jgi:superfamily II DNA/RNA helicase